MCSIRTILLFVLVSILSSAGAVFGQATSTITINEPATVKIDDLVKQADTVVIVRILSGDTEHYPTAVYKAEVLNSFKGVPVGEKIYFGPFTGYGVGSQYLAFLQRSKKDLKPVDQSNTSGLSYGLLKSSHKIMYDGYSVMPIDYICIFDGKEISQQCDYGVRFNTHQITLPGKIKTFPPNSLDESDSDNKWVRKEGIVSLLEHLRDSSER
jgi:hypothetical protein